MWRRRRHVIFNRRGPVMRRVVLRWIVLVAVACLLVPPALHAQGQRPQYKPLLNQEMSQAGTWDTWIQAFNALTGRQRAEVVRRHIALCLEAFEMTEQQRTLVREYSARFVTDEAYSLTDPAKRAALQSDMKPAMEHAQAVLGNELYGTIFYKKPPISVIEAVKNDPAFK
jgi:hypothetical protein